MITYGNVGKDQCGYQNWREISKIMENPPSSKSVIYSPKFQLTMHEGAPVYSRFVMDLSSRKTGIVNVSPEKWYIVTSGRVLTTYNKEPSSISVGKPFIHVSSITGIRLYLMPFWEFPQCSYLFMLKV